MRRKLLSNILRHRYKIAIFVLLAAASAGCILLIGARVAYSDSLRHINLVWNLFLAWIPFVLAYLGYALSWKRPFLYIFLPIVVFLWLVFLPNAPYLLTDLQHLNELVTNVPLWYDVLLMIWFSWTGMLLGVISLYLMHEIVIRAFGKLAGWIFVFAVSGLSSLGIYLGRFLRWNSWDLLQEPQEVIEDSLSLLLNPSRGTIGFTLLFTAFFLFVYLTLYAFGHMLQEQEEAAPLLQLTKK
ncbi:MAG: DUF1361 domain-containing protein [Candidatus Villigracilaceae bacterium]